MNAETRGAVAQLMFEGVALDRGWLVHRPVYAGSEHDALIQFTPGGRYYRVQVKRVYPKDAHRTINLKRRDGSRYKNIDYVVAVEVSTGQMWMIPFSKLTNPATKQPKGRVRLTESYYTYSLVRA